MLRLSTHFASRFADDRRGNVAMIFALVLVPIIGIVSLSIDYGRALKTKSLINNAADAALHGILDVITMDRSELERRVRVNLDANLPEDLRGIPFKLMVNEPTRTVQLTTETVVPTAIMSLIGISKMDVAVTSTVRWEENKPLFDPDAVAAGKPPTAETQRAAEQFARDLKSQILRGGSAGAPAAVPAFNPEALEAARSAIKNPDVQRMQAEIEARMRDAFARARH